MKEVKNIKLTIFVIFLIITLSLSGCTSNNQISENAINFSFTTIDGKEKELSDYYGKIILIDLFGVNCGPCQYQMFELKKVSENYSKDDVVIISIDVWVTSGETINDIKNLINAYKEQVDIDLDWTFAIDDPQGTIGSEYGTTVPTLYIIDKNGNIYYEHTGLLQYSELSEKIEEII